MAAPATETYGDLVVPDTDDRRQAPRLPCDLDAYCRQVMVRGASPWEGQVVNVSRGGLALLLTRRFEKGTLLSVELQDRSQTVARSMFARVVHASPYDQGRWLHGCAFSGELDDDDLRAFCADRIQPEAPDCRAWVRFTCDVPTTCTVGEGKHAAEAAVRIVNIAPGGVGLLSLNSVPEGSILRLALRSSTQDRARSVLVRVVQSVDQGAAGWLLGCEFAEALGNAELLELM